MSTFLTERPEAEPLPTMASAGIIVNGRYLPPPPDHDGKLWVRTSVLIQSSPQLLYTLWRDLEHIPLWQEQIESVTVTSPTRSHWIMKHGDSTVEWDSEILNDEPGKRIVWASVAGEVHNAGEVVFEEAPGGRGTLVTILQEFGMGKIASALATMTGRNPKQAVIENLRHFKALAETGEIPRNTPQPHGDRGTSGNLKKSAYGETVPTPQGTLTY